MSRTNRLRVVLLLWFGLFAAAIGHAQQAIPKLTAQVVDTTGTLSAEFTSRLIEQLRAFEARKGSQIAVLLTQTTQPETIEQFGIRVADTWKLGRKKVDDGAILIVALEDRTLRIEVGYGLEGALNDATSKRIIEEHIVPSLREGKLENAIQNGVEQMMRVVDGEPLPDPAPTTKPQGNNTMTDTQGILVFLFAVTVAVGQALRKTFGKLPAVIVSSLIAGSAAAWMAGLLSGLFVAVVVGFFVLGGGNAAGLAGGLGGRTHRSGGFGGGFGGGGGGFGGGGASGRW